MESEIVESFQRDGAVVLRGVLSDRWLAELADGLEVGGTLDGDPRFPLVPLVRLSPHDA